MKRNFNGSMHLWNIVDISHLKNLQNKSPCKLKLYDVKVASDLHKPSFSLPFSLFLDILFSMTITSLVLTYIFLFLLDNFSSLMGMNTVS